MFEIKDTIDCAKEVGVGKYIYIILSMAGRDSVDLITDLLGIVIDCGLYLFQLTKNAEKSLDICESRFLFSGEMFDLLAFPTIKVVEPSISSLKYWTATFRDGLNTSYSFIEKTVNVFLSNTSNVPNFFLDQASNADTKLCESRFLFSGEMFDLLAFPYHEAINVVQPMGVCATGLLCLKCVLGSFYNDFNVLYFYTSKITLVILSNIPFGQEMYHSSFELFERFNFFNVKKNVVVEKTGFEYFFDRLGAHLNNETNFSFCENLFRTNCFINPSEWLSEDILLV